MTQHALCMCLQITADDTEVAAVPGTYRPAAANGAGSDCRAPCGLSRIYGRRQLCLQRHRAVNQDVLTDAFHLPYHERHPGSPMGLIFICTFFLMNSSGQRGEPSSYRCCRVPYIPAEEFAIELKTSDRQTTTLECRMGGLRLKVAKKIGFNQGLSAFEFSTLNPERYEPTGSWKIEADPNRVACGR